MTPTAAEISAAPASMQRELIEAVWLERNPEPPVELAPLAYIPESEAVGAYAEWLNAKAHLMLILGLGAFVDAVIAMVPEGRKWSLHSTARNRAGWEACLWPISQNDAFRWPAASTPALALLAALVAAGEA